MSWILRILILLLLVAFIWRTVVRAWRGLTAGPGTKRTGAKRTPAAAALVRDPVCGTYILPSRAVSAQSGGQTTYFCSDRCRRTWQRRSA